MADPTIRPANVAVLLKLETTEAVDASPAAAIDAIPVEADSVTYNTPWTTEASNEATGSLVSGAPLIIGQAAKIGFRSRIKGAGAGVTYSSSVKPPLHAAMQACGWRGQFTAAVATALATAGSTTSATLASGFPATAMALVGMMLTITAGTGVGATPLVMGYTAGRLATLADLFGTALDTTSSIALPANWTYASTSPSDATARLTDQPSATIYIYEDGRLLKFVGCRGTMALDGKSARPGYDTFDFSGIYAGAVDAAIPSGLVVANHSAPVLAQGGAASSALIVNRKPLPVSTWSLDPGSQLEVPDDPNTTFGFGAGQIVDRTPVLKIDPLMALISNRDTVTDIGNGTTMPVALRHGSLSGNRWSLLAPLAQPTEAAPGTRGKLKSEDISFQLRSLGRDAVTRDTDRVLCFS